MAATSKRKSVRLCTVLGSGGHTTEMLALLEKLGCNYTPRFYVIAKSDPLSLKKVTELEKKGDGSFELYLIGRSREVLQSYFTSIFTTLLAFMESIWIVSTHEFDLLICNGPGTCIPLCLAVALFDLLRLRDTKIIYFESICRVKKLSLSALILYYLRIPDLIAVQWPDLVQKYPRTKLIDNIDES